MAPMRFRVASICCCKPLVFHVRPGAEELALVLLKRALRIRELALGATARGPVVFNRGLRLREPRSGGFLLAVEPGEFARASAIRASARAIRRSSSCRSRRTRSSSIMRPWAHQDLNLGPTGYEPAALTAELWARGGRTRSAARNSPAGAGARVAAPPATSFGELAELPRPGRVPQLANRLGLDLPYSLARNVELLPDLLRRPLARLPPGHGSPKRFWMTASSRA